MDEEVVLIYTMEYYSAIKRNEFESDEVMWMNLEPIMQSSVSQRKINTSAYTWNLEKWFWWTYLQGRNRDADIEKGLWTEREGEVGTNGESSPDVFILPSVKLIASGSLPYSTGSLAQCRVMTWRRVAWEGGSWGRGCVYTHSWVTLLYSRNQYNTVKQLHSN